MPDQIKPGTYLGFDYGHKRIGIAVGQTISKSASALEIVAANKNQHWLRIEQLIVEWQPIGFVVGMPETADGKTGKIHQRIKQFIAELQKRFDLTIYQIDESLSSYAAKDLLSPSTKSKIRRLDDAAAAVILQTWFNQQ